MGGSVGFCMRAAFSAAARTKLAFPGDARSWYHRPGFGIDHRQEKIGCTLSSDE